MKRALLVALISLVFTAADGVAAGLHDDITKRQKDFLAALPMRLLCVPEVSGGITRRTKSGKWESGPFQIREDNKFTTTIGKFEHFSEESRDECLDKARQQRYVTYGDYFQYRIKEGDIVCMVYRYFSDTPDNKGFARLCNVIAIGVPVHLDCDDFALNGFTFISIDNPRTALGFGEGTITKGTCNPIPK